MKINGFNITVGADPEIFVKEKGSDVPISAHIFDLGTKQNPSPVEDGALQVDGTALEFNIDPANDFDEFEHHLKSVQEQLLASIPDKYEFFNGCVAEFGEKFIKDLPDEAKILGCEADWNAYTEEENPAPDQKAGFRTAAGHVHIGWTKDVDPYHPKHMSSCIKLTKALDLYLGVPSLAWDKEQKRRELYGKAGAFRPKPYGMEYRTLSNKWLNLPQTRKLVYENTLLAMSALWADVDKTLDITLDGKTPQEVVNSGDLSGLVWYKQVLNLPVAKDYR